MSFSLRMILLITIAVLSAFVMAIYYFYVVSEKQKKSIIIAADRLKKNFNNYEVNNYIHKIDTLKKVKVNQSTIDMLVEIYNLVVSSNVIDINLKLRLKLALESKGVNISMAKN